MVEHKKFGGAWTLIKLDILEKYLAFYTTAMKNQAFKYCYIDAFAGCGDISFASGGGAVPGSALRALDYPFDKYVFIEEDRKCAELLKRRIQHYAGRDIEVVENDCNQYIQQINSYPWEAEGWRGVIFLDPFALELQWSSLREIADTQIFDVWYLFPLMALNRLLRKDRRISDGHRSIINKVLGTSDWENEVYRPSGQLCFFGEEYEKGNIDELRHYIIERLKTVFPAVSPRAKILKASRTNTPLYLLCFAVSNPSHKAIGLAKKGADFLLAK